METKHFNFNRDKLKALKKIYKKAQDFGRDRFLFENQILLTSYAKYLIEYLETKFSMTNIE